LIIHVWTRVHVMPNPGKSGIGIVLEAHKDGAVIGEREIGRTFKKLTNYQAEIEAVSYAILILERPSTVIVHSASQPFILSASKYPNTDAINAEKEGFSALFQGIREGGHNVTWEYQKAGTHENSEVAKLLAIEHHNRGVS